MATCTLRPLSHVPRRDLESLFDEESAMWALDLLWDFEPTRRRLEAALDDGGVNGFAAIKDGSVVGYATYAIDGSRGVIGSVYASSAARGEGLEDLLVRESLQRLGPAVTRMAEAGARGGPTMDCQTLFSSERLLHAPFRAFGFDTTERMYMDLDPSLWRPTARTPGTAAFRRLERSDIGKAAQLIFSAHRDTIRNDASSSFDTPESCERILRQIVMDEVCGSFDTGASRVLHGNGGLAAMVLLTWPYPRVAHLSEVATSPDHRRRGLARQGLVDALDSVLSSNRADRITLSVTSSNRAAISLYESVGFKPRVRYLSHVWRGPRS